MHQLEDQQRLFVFLFSAFTTSESVMLAVFGNLYTIYTAYMRESGGPICSVLRIIGIFLTLAILSVSAANLCCAYSISKAYIIMPAMIRDVLYVIPIVLGIPPIIICRGMLKDAGVL